LFDHTLSQFSAIFLYDFLRDFASTVVSPINGELYRFPGISVIGEELTNG
jgi:hypothetical protein